VKPRTEVAEPVSNIDTFASVLGMLGIPIPDGVKQQGMDFSPLLRGEKVPWRDTIFGQYDLHNGGQANMRMIRSSQWKLVRYHFTNGLDELYNLESDSDEQTNLINRPEHRVVREQLQTRLTDWQRSIKDPILEIGNRSANNTGQ
jgi:uncharacterized sulfatase